MEITSSSILDANDEGDIDVRYDPVDICPLCHKGISHAPLNSYFSSKNLDAGVEYVVYIDCVCPTCHRLFVCEYHYIDESYDSPTYFFVNQPYAIYPKAFDTLLISPFIRNLSPNFAETYAQSVSAELHDLTQIVGGGYRKALEFLVKDYLCQKSPEKSDEIKHEFLAQSIKRIEDERIRTFAERATWIGNDELHYIRKYENLDIEQMKVFIHAMVQSIDLEETFRVAADLSKHS